MKIISPTIFYGLIVLFSALSSVTLSQTCISADPGTLPHFKKGNKVYYQFDSSIPQNSAEMNQIKTAFGNWHSANQSNCSKVQFIDGIAPQGLGYASVKIINAAINGNYVSAGGAPAAIDPTSVVGGEILSANLYFNPNLKISPMDPRKVYDPALEHYDTIFIKEAMHEIGHGMGLTHYTQTHAPSCT